jgi:cytochrome c-type biogenesis protein CcmH
MRLRAATLAAIVAGAFLASAGAASATAPRASLTDIENDVMCVACRESLAVAQSPQAYAERSFIRHLIDQGQTKTQIERALVAQYGPAVLGRPPANGFNLTVYILPPAILLIGIATLALTLPRWRRKARAAAGATTSPAAVPKLDPAAARRLDDELARFE